MKFILLLFLVLSFSGFSKERSPVYEGIPMVAKYYSENSHFTLKNPIKYSIEDGVDIDVPVFGLKKILKDVYNLDLIKAKSFEESDIAFFKRKAKAEDGYFIDTHDNKVLITASTTGGFYYSFPTLLYLFHKEQQTPADEIAIHKIKIEDYPRFQWRGLMIDSARHFQSVEKIKEILFQMSILNLNKFHWHLTDNTGWRIESTRYPKLNSIGSYIFKNKPWQEVNGYYTKKDIKEILDYAKKLNIDVIPEIDLPGHAGAVLEAYPEYLCPSNRDITHASKKKSNRGWTEIFCVSNPKSYDFLFDVLDETFQTFNGLKYFHIGGDEVPHQVWNDCPDCSLLMENKKIDERQLQKEFLDKVITYIENKGIKTVYWADSPFKKNDPIASIATLWQSQDSINDILSYNKPMINSHGWAYYLDYPEHKVNPKSNWMPNRDLKAVYNFNIAPISVPVKSKNQILGGACTLWTEEILEEDIGYMLYPRLLAFAEQAWSTKTNKNFNNFKKRLKVMEQFYNKVGINYSKNLNLSDIYKEANVTITKNFPQFGKFDLAYTVDKKDTSAFLGSFPKNEDYVLWKFKKPKEANKLSILTGGFFNHDAPNGELTDAKVLISNDGTNFEDVGYFKNGIFEKNFNKKTISAVKVVFTKTYKDIISINELIIE